MLATFIALAIGTTLRLSPLEHAIASITGVRDAAVLPKHLSPMVGCLFLVGWVDSAVPPRTPEPRWRRLAGLKPRLVLGALAVTAAIAIFPGSAPARLAPSGDTDFINSQWGDGWGPPTSSSTSRRSALHWLCPRPCAPRPPTAAPQVRSDAACN
ncbi:hypothetical protein GCM10010252_11790 [Streptomyces aureoverticillatus]|nr:hypothetical protein GCM10010252_11790 [Streptomyces aureoverticillatus]